MKILIVLLLAVASIAHAQTNLRLTHAWAVGGGIDTVSRTLSDRLEKLHGYRVVVEIRSGANGTIAAVHTARAKDLALLIDQTTLYLNHHLVAGGMGIDPYKDLIALSSLAVQHSVIVVPWNLQVNSIEQLISTAKKQPEHLAFGHPGIGHPSYIVMRLMERDSQIRFLSVPYKNTMSVLTDLVGDRIQVTNANTTAVLPHARAQRLRILAKTDSSAVVPDFPNLPALAKWTTVNQSINVVLFASASLDRAQLGIIRRDVDNIVRDDREFAERIASTGLVARPMTSSQLQSIMAQDIKTWLGVLKDDVINQ